MFRNLSARRLQNFRISALVICKLKFFKNRPEHWGHMFDNWKVNIFRWASFFNHMKPCTPIGQRFCLKNAKVRNSVLFGLRDVIFERQRSTLETSFWQFKIFRKMSFLRNGKIREWIQKRPLLKKLNIKKIRHFRFASFKCLRKCMHIDTHFWQTQK